MIIFSKKDDVKRAHFSWGSKKSCLVLEDQKIFCWASNANLHVADGILPRQGILIVKKSKLRQAYNCYLQAS